MFKFNETQVRQYKARLFMLVIVLFSFLAILPLILILGYLLKQGFAVLNWEFLVRMPAPLGEIGGGIANAMVGTLLLILVATIVAIPLGLGAGIYLAENKSSRLAYYVRLSMEILQGVPSIVIGLIAYAWFVLPFKTFSGFSGALALAMMMLPIIVRTTEETLLLIPVSLKEAALALGVPYWKTMLKVIMPAGSSSIVTGILLSVARVSGETAPLLFTAFGNPFLNFNLGKPLESLPHLIYNYATSPYEEWHNLAWGASLVLVLGVLVLNVLAKLVTQKWKVNY